jgi:uroporphyrin-III C-methyltransferase/precorrin-2 dehydrogenase/sirohydrochlorin ferrochelatase
MGSFPTQTQTGRMSPLARLPAFFMLEGKRCIVAGGGGPAAWKAELLSAAGARVDVFALKATDDLRGLAVDPPCGAVNVHERRWQPADLSGAAMAVAECADDVEAAQFAAAARAAGVPVNVIDRPAYCDFAFAAIVNRSPLIIGISTDGAAPVFAQAVRARIETLIPKGFARWAEAARKWRPQVQALALSFRGRRNFWERFTDRALTRPDVAPTETDLAVLLKPADAEESGSIVLVGAGPGDPELLTLRAVRALQSADVILFDQGVSAEILDFARREAKKMLVGAAGHVGSDQPDNAAATMMALAKAGRRVVRLRVDDAASTRGTDEEIAAACRRAGITVEIVPGVTGVLAATSQRENTGETPESDFGRVRA